MKADTRRSLRARVLVAAAAAVAITVATDALVGRYVASPATRIAATLVVATALVLLVARAVVGPVVARLRAIESGLARFAEGDFAVRVKAGRRDDVGEVVDRVNLLGEALQRRHDDGYQRELLLDTVLESAPMVVLIANEAGRVVHANAPARAFFGGGERPDGRALEELLATAPAELRAAIDGPEDALITIERGREPGDAETLHVARRVFRLNTQLHRLLLIRSLTRELAREEARTYKNVLRLVSHELNNSLAPILSLLHSGKQMLGDPELAGEVGPVFDVIEERSQHLRRFLDGYAALARLPTPAPREVAWLPFLEAIRALYPFRIVEIPEAPGHFDPAQIQQLLINLLKNAVEAGSAPDAIELSVVRGPGGEVALRVADRGAGIDDEALGRARTPFHATSKAGGGVGLALCREIASAHGGSLSLRQREGGGVEVECHLPNGPGARAAREITA